MPKGIITFFKSKKEWESTKIFTYFDNMRDGSLDGDVVDVNSDLVEPNIIRFRYYNSYRHVATGHIRMPRAMGKIDQSDATELKNLLREFFKTLESHMYNRQDEGYKVYRPRVRVVTCPNSQIILDTLTPVDGDISPFNVAAINYNLHFRFSEPKKSAIATQLRQELKDWFVQNGYHREDFREWARRELTCTESLYFDYPSDLEIDDEDPD